MVFQKPNCYECKWRRDLIGSAHSCCEHPKCKNAITQNPLVKVLGMLGSARNNLSPLPMGLKVKGNPVGIKNGWFNFPLNFDPIWVEECDGFEPKKDDINKKKFVKK